MKPLSPIPEETNLIVVMDRGREFHLQPEAAKAWRKLKKAAAADNIDLRLVSAFRSVGRQEKIIEEKRKKGILDYEIFRINTPAGCSEHHSGKAIDINTEGFAPLEEEFEASEAYTWMSKNGSSYGFTLSYPRNNEYGIAYEPWHWLYTNHAQPVAGGDAAR